MEKTIPVPKLLEKCAARDLNNKMLTSNQSFVFLGESDIMINRIPSSFREAFELYVTRLYVLYHDCGMAFLKCYLNEDSKVNNKYSCSSHIRFVDNCRACHAHSNNPHINQSVYHSLVNYYFKGDTSFHYSDWCDFWVNATDAHWEVLVRKIVKGSDMVMKLMENIASHIPSYKEIYESVSEIFLNKRIFSYTNKSGVNENIDIYIKSFDSRFLKLICLYLRDNSLWKDKQIAERELKAFYNMTQDPVLFGTNKLEPSQMRDELIGRLMCSLKNNVFADSELLYQSICQNIKQLIDEQIDKDLAIEEDDILDP